MYIHTSFVYNKPLLNYLSIWIYHRLQIYLSILLHRIVVLASPPSVQVNKVKSQFPATISSTCILCNSSFFNSEVK